MKFIVVIDASRAIKYLLKSVINYIRRMLLQSGSVMEQPDFKNVNHCLNTNIYSNLETSRGKSYKIYLNVVPFFNTNVN